MNLSAPKNVTFYIAVALVVLGLLGSLIELPLVTDQAFWFVLIGFVVLAIGVVMRDM